MSDAATRTVPQMRGLTPSDEGRADHWYRYSVRCDRAIRMKLNTEERVQKMI